jgi:hypothetical protein
VASPEGGVIASGPGRQAPRSRSVAVEDQQHRGRRAPDVAFAIGNRPEVAARRAQHAEVPLLVRGIEDERERHFEDVGDFDGIRRELERRLDPADDRRHAKARHRLVLREMTQHGDVGRGQTDFLGASRSAASSCDGRKARRGRLES